MRLHIYSSVNAHFVQILHNTYLSISTRSSITGFLMNRAVQHSLYNLIKSAINDQIHPDTESGQAQMAMLLGQLPILDKLGAENCDILLKLILDDVWKGP